MTVNDELPPRRWLNRLARHQPLLLPLLSGLLAVLLALGFVTIAGFMLAGDTHGLDMLLLRAAQAWRAEHPWLSEVMRDITAFGSTAGLTLVTTVTVFYLLLVGRRGSGWLVAASVLSGTLVMSLLKIAFNRARPDPAFAELVVSGMSFPSGHSSMSALVYLTGGTLLAASHSRWAERSYILGAAALLAGLVGLSRVVLGVHWASDVLAGWAFGGAWAILWLVIAHSLGRRARR